MGEDNLPGDSSSNKFETLVKNLTNMAETLESLEEKYSNQTQVQSKEVFHRK